MQLPITYTHAQVKQGTGWTRNVHFVALPELVTALAIEAERYRAEVDHQDSAEDRAYFQGAAATLRALTDRFRDLTNS